MRASRALLACVLLSLAAGCLSGDAPAGPGADGRPDVTFRALRVETELGAFTALLWPELHPETTAFLEKLAGNDYYVGREFGRVIPGFVIQEVDRTGGTTDQPERVPLEAGTSVTFSAGAIGIARDADPDSGGSEFFVMDFPASTLYGNYTAFAQVVEGMEVVHAIARVPAVKTGPAPLVSSSLVPGSPAYFGVHDRVPVQPVKMSKVSVVDVTLPAAEAARYPLRIGDTARTDTVRATLEWPADLDAGNASTLTWYVAGRDTDPATSQARDPPQPDLAGATVRVEGPGAEGAAALATREDPAVPGKLVFSWTPPMRGSYVLRLENGGAEVAFSNVTVPTPPPRMPE